MQRNYNKHLELLNNTSHSQGCIHMPAFPFDAENYLPDMLHMKKGIITKLVNQLVDWTLIQKREALLAEMKKHKIPFVYCSCTVFIYTTMNRIRKISTGINLFPQVVQRGKN